MRESDSVPDFRLKTTPPLLTYIMLLVYFRLLSVDKTFNYRKNTLIRIFQEKRTGGF